MGYVLNTDFSQIAPSDGGTRSYFPVSDSKGWLCMMTESDGKENQNKTGRILVCKLTGMEGPVQGKIHDVSYNLANPNPEAVRIATEELSAIAHVTGHLRVGNSSELHNKPFRVVIALDDKAQEKYPGSTRVVGYRDQQGNKPSEAGQAAMTGNPGQAAASTGGFQTGTFNPGQQAAPVQQGGFGQQAAPAQDPNQQGGFAQTPQQQPSQGGFAQQGGGAPSWA